jgi:hypothetical protein
LVECLTDQGIKNIDQEEYTADLLKVILAKQYESLEDEKTNKWLQSIPDQSILKDKDTGEPFLSYQLVKKYNGDEMKKEQNNGEGKKVIGYYSDIDVPILLDALLTSKGVKRIAGGDHQDIVEALAGGERTNINLSSEFHNCHNR